MEITLKSLQIFERMTQETTAFHASLYIDGKAVGECGNHGTGGETWYRAIHPDYWPFIKKAEEYCKTLPPFDYDGMKIPCDLEGFIDNLVEDAAMKKETKRFKAKMLKDQEKGVLVGNDNEYRIFSMSSTVTKKVVKISDLLASPKGKIALQNNINKIKEGLKEGDRILNTNLPKEVL